LIVSNLSQGIGFEIEEFANAHSDLPQQEQRIGD
jgi:hypothetical protein